MDKPSCWVYTNNNIKDHELVIAQECKIFALNSLCTILLMKHKVFSDFQFHFAFRLLDRGYGGFVFRYRDDFNFYLLEFSKDGFGVYSFYKGFK